MFVDLGRFPAWLILFHILLFGLSSAKAEDKLPDPLPLKTALGFADKHPRLQISAEQDSKYKHQAPLYLNCHNFAYNNLSRVDNQRSASLKHLVSPKAQQELHILHSYFDVHLSDLAFMADNEEMTTAYLRFDRARHRMELKQYSELVVAELEAIYFMELQRYHASGATQGVTRSVLAQELGKPADIPRNVVPMQAWKIPKELPELGDILENIKKNNSWLDKHKNDLKSDEQALLNGQLRQLVSELLLRLETLNTTHERFEKASFWQDLKLEQSRTLYEQEVKADLGNSMAQQTRVQYQQQHAIYCLNSAWAQLNILQGKPLLEAPPKPKREPAQ